MNDLGVIALHEPGAAFIARRKLFELVQACGGDEALASRVAGETSSLCRWLERHAPGSAVAVGALLWLSRVEVQVVGTDGDVELWAGQAHLPASVVARTAAIPRSAKSAALGRQLDPAAFVLHRTWVGPLVLVVLEDPDDPTPYWLVSSRNPEKLIAALRS